MPMVSPDNGFTEASPKRSKAAVSPTTMIAGVFMKAFAAFS